MKILLERDGVDPNSKDKGGLTPLPWLAKSRIAEVVKLLLKQGATFNAKEALDVTALRVVVEGGHGEVIKLRLDSHSLLESGRLKAPDIEALLHGKWSGNYYYRYKSKSTNDPVSFTLSVRWELSAVDKLSVVGDGQNTYGPFAIHGDVRRNVVISFAKMYAQYGWIYSGQLDTESGAMPGWRGSHDQDIQGPFAFYRDPANAAGLSQATLLLGAYLGSSWGTKQCCCW